MKSFASYLRVVVLVAIAVAGTEYLMETPPGEWAILEYPFAGVFIGIVLVFAIAVEASIASLRNVLYQSLTEEGKERYHAAEKAKISKFEQKWENLMQSMTQSKEIEEEHEIILDHDYDGIKELDNRLPPWWLYGFYATIVFGIIYLVRFHVIGDYTQAEEYEREVAIAQEEIEAYLATAEDIINIDNVTFLDEKEHLNAGEKIFTANCVACHRADGGGGIGPNLTDEYWILGGGIKNVFKVISEGGRPGKGMVSWKSDLTAKEMQQVASYVLTLQENDPADGKAPEGDLWEGEE